MWKQVSRWTRDCVSQVTSYEHPILVQTVRNIFLLCHGNSDLSLVMQLSLDCEVCQNIPGNPRHGSITSVVSCLLAVDQWSCQGQRSLNCWHPVTIWLSCFVWLTLDKVQNNTSSLTTNNQWTLSWKFNLTNVQQESNHGKFLLKNFLWTICEWVRHMINYRALFIVKISVKSRNVSNNSLSSLLLTRRRN